MYALHHRGQPTSFHAPIYLHASVMGILAEKEILVSVNKNPINNYLSKSLFDIVNLLR